jgi:hypothetical protein
LHLCINMTRFYKQIDFLRKKISLYIQVILLSLSEMMSQ